MTEVVRWGGGLEPKKELKSLKLSETRPDLPVVSLSQLMTWDRCKFQWFMKHKKKFSRFGKSHKLELGTMGHALQFDWYKTGQDNSADFVNVWMKDLTALDPEQVKNIEVAVVMFKLYTEMWSPREDKGYITEFLEYHFEVLMETPRGRQFILQGYIDRGSRDLHGRLWLEDYKWRGKFSSPIQLLMDPQLSYYQGAMQLLGYDVYGLMITQINTYPYVAKSRAQKTVDDLIKREKFIRTQVEIDQVMYEIGMAVEEMLEAQDQLEYRRSLRYDCDKCDYQQPCLMGLKGFDPYTFMLTSPGFYQRESSSSRPKKEEGGIPELQAPQRVRIAEDYVVDLDDQTITIE